MYIFQGVGALRTGNHYMYLTDFFQFIKGNMRYFISAPPRERKQRSKKDKTSILLQLYLMIEDQNSK